MLFRSGVGSVPVQGRIAAARGWNAPERGRIAPARGGNATSRGGNAAARGRARAGSRWKRAGSSVERVVSRLERVVSRVERIVSRLERIVSRLECADTFHVRAGARDYMRGSVTQTGDFMGAKVVFGQQGIGISVLRIAGIATHPAPVLGPPSNTCLWNPWDK